MKLQFLTRGMFLLVALLSLTMVHAQEPIRIDISPKDEFPAVNTVDAHGVFTLILLAGESQKLEVELNGEYDDEIKVKVSDGTLKLTGNANPKSDLKVYFTYVSLFLIKTNGATVVKTEGPLTAQNLRLDASGASNLMFEVKTNNLNTQASGASTVILKGETSLHELRVSGAANVNAYDLKTDTTQTHISGAGNAKVNAIKRLSGQVSGAGDLRYTGMPENLEIEKSGAADLKQIGETDTTKIKLGTSKVIIIDDKDSRKKKRNKTKFDAHWGGVELGVNAFLTPKNTLDMPHAPIDYSFLDLKLNRSFAWNLNLFESNYTLIKNHVGLATGLGFAFNNYHFDNDVVLMSDSNRLYALRDTVNKSTKSKLFVTYLNIPLILEFQTNAGRKSNSMHIGVGVIGGLRLGSYSRMEMRNQRKKGDVVNRDDFYLNPLKYELTARLGWGHINLFANYALSEMFKKNKGPEVYPVTVGLALVGW